MDNKAVILIVDDVFSNVQMLSMILEDEYEVKTALSGQEALTLVHEEPKPDLILLDIEMPQMNGYQVLHKLKANQETKHIPVIFVTGNIEIEDEERGFLLGAVDYITKPVRPTIVMARVKSQVMIKLQRDELLHIALHDKLTGLYNRHSLTEFGESRFASSKRHGDDLSIIMCDVDHFKNINDTYGHLGGDKVLQAMGNLLQCAKRRGDIAARFGGEEFVILLWKCDKDEAYEKAEEIRITIEALDVEGIQVTSSFGVAQVSPEDKNFESVLKNADSALYEAKETGRNKTVIY